MKHIIAVSLLAAAALAQDQTPAQGNPQPAPQTQQTAPPQQQPPAQPAETQPQPAAEAAPQNPAAAAPSQATIATTNRVENFNGPTLSDVYCSGFISKQTLRASGTVVAGSGSPEEAAFVTGQYIYLKGDDVQPGKEYALLRHAGDPNRYESYPGQLANLNKLGELYQDMGRAKVLFQRNKVAVAQIEFSCDSTMPGDIAVPFQERPRPEFKQTNFDQFAAPNGKTTGRIVLGKDFDVEVGNHRIVYLNIGETQGLKPGDYFRVVREYTQIADNPTEALPFYAPSYEDTQKDPPKGDFHKLAGDLPRRSIGELMVLNISGNSATAMTTRAPEGMHLGDGIEMIEATPIVAAAPEPAAAPQPPTISCSVSRSTIQVGETANITCNGLAEEGHSVAYNYQASAGQITPRENRATLTGTAPGPVTVTASAVDDRNLSAQTTVSVDVQAAPAAVTPTATPTPSLLNELIFKPNSAYVDNRAKAVLDDDALRMQREANATLMLEGSANPSENEALAGQRAENAKTYLTRSKGIDPSRIQTRSAQTKTGAKVGVIMVPAGANPQ